jgi:serine O-acetyltransferase
VYYQLPGPGQIKRNIMNNIPEDIMEIQGKFCQEVPSVESSHLFIDDMVRFLFPVKNNKKPGLRETKIKFTQLEIQFESLLKPLSNSLKRTPEELSEEFFNSIHPVYTELLEEADYYLKNDPAAYSIEEVILCYPGFFAVTVYRLSNILYKLEIPLLPRIISEYAHSKTGIDINPGAKIGKKFFIDHGTGIVIGETTIIGDNVKIYQGVTLGALHVEKGMTNTKRHPTIGDNVIIYAGSTILGGETVIGHDTVIGGNVWLTKSVDPHTVVYHLPQIVYKNGKNVSTSDDFTI